MSDKDEYEPDFKVVEKVRNGIVTVLNSYQDKARVIDFEIALLEAHKYVILKGISNNPDIRKMLVKILSGEDELIVGTNK